MSSTVGAGTGRILKRKRRSSEQVVPGSSTPSAEKRHNLHFNPGRLSAVNETHRTFSDPNYPIPDFDDVYAKMRHPVTGISISDRRYRLLSYQKCFVGKEAVDWMSSNLQVTRDVAVKYGEKLMSAGILSHVTQSEPFSDAHFFFRFQEDDESCVLNMKRVWDSKLETRPAVVVSQQLLTQLACLCEEYRERFVASKNAENQQRRISSGSDPGGTDANSSSSALAPSSTPVQGIASGMLQSPLLSGVLNSLAGGTSPNIGSMQKSTTDSGDCIDFSLLAKSEAFRQYMLAAAELQRVQLVGLTHDELLAFFVNLYNIVCLHAYVVHGPPSNFWRRWIFFRSLSYRVAGLDMTLDDIEHGILRGNKRHPTLVLMQQLRPQDPKCQFVLTSRDGRIHFVISAGTRSDPPVRILNGENLQEELHEATVEFLACAVKVDTEAKKVTLPRIFLWYADDFPSPENKLLRWVAKYLPVDRSDALLGLLENQNTPTISYESFDWSNAEARFEAAAIRRKRRKLVRESGTGTAISSAMNLENLFPFVFPPQSSHREPGSDSPSVSASRNFGASGRLGAAGRLSDIPLPALQAPPLSGISPASGALDRQKTEDNTS